MRRSKPAPDLPKTVVPARWADFRYCSCLRCSTTPITKSLLRSYLGERREGEDEFNEGERGVRYGTSIESDVESINRGILFFMVVVLAVIALASSVTRGVQEQKCNCKENLLGERTFYTGIHSKIYLQQSANFPERE